MMYTDINLDYHSHILTTFNLTLPNNGYTCDERTSVLKGLSICNSESLALMAKFN